MGTKEMDHERGFRNPSADIIPLDRISSFGEDSGIDQAHGDERVLPTLAELQASVLFHGDELDRALERPQITGIAFSGTVGVGLFVTSGQIITVSGSLGYVIAYIVAALVVIAVMRCLAEMVSVRPVSGALMDFPHTFVDPALGFAVGVTYWLSQCLSMAAITATAARTADSFTDGEGVSKNGLIAIIIGLYIITLLSNLCGVKLYGNLERVVKWFKILIFFILWVLMILVKAGVGSQSVEPEQPVPRAESGYGNFSFTPYLRWNGFNEWSDLTEGGYQTGIAGSWGQFLAIWTSIIFALFSCMGGDIVIVTAGEAKHPRKDLPAAARFMYLAPLTFYVISAFLVGLNINYMDPDLFRPWANPAPAAPAISHSPFIIVLKQTSMKNVLPTFLNACFLVSAYTAANTGLYASSRTLFALSQLYENKYTKAAFGRTNNGNTPMVAILFCSLFGFLALLGLVDETFNEPIQVLTSFFTGAVGCVYASECVAFLCFKSGLSKAGLSRNSKAYMKKHYRAHWQPACAIFGLLACIIVVIFSGWPAIYLLKERNTLKTADQLKGVGDLVADVVGAYSGPLLFFALFFGYKIGAGTKFQRYEDYEDAYFVPEFDNEWPTRSEDYDGPGWKYVLREIWSFVR